MNQSSDDSQIRELVQRLKRTEQRHVPGFEDVLQRSVRQPDRRPARRLQVAVVCCAVTMLLVALLFVRSQFGDPNGRERPNIAKGNGPGQPADSTQSDSLVEVNFKHIHSAVDDYFRNSEVEAVELPEWTIRTDSLLALNLKIPLTEE